MSERNSRSRQQAQIAGTSKVMAIDDLIPNGWNYNTQSAAVFRKLVNAIRRHGFTKPVIVYARPDSGTKRIIVDGEHRWRAVKALGMTAVSVVDLGLIPDERAKELTIILNELAGEANEARLADLLREINQAASTNELLEVMPFSETELDAYLSTIKFQFTSLPEEDPLPEEHQQPAPAKLQLVFAGDNARELKQLAAKLGMKPNEAIMVALRNRKAS
jgi:ParB-like chromosome segregation protein Spo0J